MSITPTQGRQGTSVLSWKDVQLCRCDRTALTGTSTKPLASSVASRWAADGGELSPCYADRRAPLLCCGLEFSRCLATLPASIWTLTTE
jgi:hypothetical protein